MPLYTQEGIRNKKLPKQCRAHGASPFSNAISYTLLSGGPTFLDFTNGRRSTSFGEINGSHSKASGLYGTSPLHSMVFIKPHLDHNVTSPPHFMNIFE
jgi:hypothetical protein